MFRGKICREAARLWLPGSLPEASGRIDNTDTDTVHGRLLSPSLSDCISPHWHAPRAHSRKTAGPSFLLQTTKSHSLPHLCRVSVNNVPHTVLQGGVPFVNRLWPSLELSGMTSQCLNRRIDRLEKLSDELGAWQLNREIVKRQFTTEDARIKFTVYIQSFSLSRVIA
jgi:hypothetical protein